MAKLATPLNTDALDRELDELAAAEAKSSALHQPLGQPLHRRLTDAEILAQGDAQQGGEYDIDPSEIPDGMVYQWIRVSVAGEETSRARAMMLAAVRSGWKEVPASRHPGRWTLPNYQGSIEVGGQVLMELPSDIAYERTRYQYLNARRQTQQGDELLRTAPSGTGPRDHPGVRPQVHRGFEAIDIE